MNKKNILISEQQLADLMRDLLGGMVSPTMGDSEDSGKEKSSDENKGSYKENGFTYLDLNTKEGYEAYKDIADKFIQARNSSAGISGEMIASSAKKYSSQGYVPPELALAQLAEEGGLSTNPNAKPIRTKNPYNVGNVDSGKVVKHQSIQSGIDAYFDLITRRYLKGKKADELVSNFVNDQGQKYASGTQYEKDLKSIISGMGKFTELVLAKLKSKESNIA